MNARVGMVAVAVLALLGASAGPADPEAVAKRKIRMGTGAYTDIDAHGLATMLNRKAFTLVNVHVPYEGEIEGTDLFVPFDQVGATAGRLPADRNARLVVYCMSGRMSTIAVRALVGLGYRDVWHLDGGMIAWQRAGYPLVRRSG